MKAWKRLGEPVKVHDGWRKVFQKTFLTPDGKEMIAEISDREGMKASAVIALTTENKVIVARQFRCGPEKIFDELPGGGVESGEEPEEAVKGELYEETGYQPGQLEYLGKVYKHAWMATEWHYFLARDCRKVEAGPNPEEFEYIDVELLTIQQLFHNAKNAQMTDIEAVFLAYEKLEELEEKND